MLCSDVLKRHVEFHPQYYKPKRDFIACTRCRDSKTKCDEESPCKPCSRRGVQCVRPSSNKIILNTASAVLEPPAPSLSSPPSSLVHTPEEPRLGESAVQDPASVRRRLDIYFTKIHPSWPILQPSMITVSGSPDPLITSIMMLASWLEGDRDHLALFNIALDEISEINSVCFSLLGLLLHESLTYFRVQARRYLYCRQWCCVSFTPYSAL